MTKRNADSSKEANKLMEQTSDVIVRADKAMNDLTLSMDEINKASQSTSKAGDLVEEIAVASDEQAQGVEQVNIAVSQMDKVVQQNAASAEEAASASQQLSAQAGQMKDFVHKLRTIASGKRNDPIKDTTRKILPKGRKKEPHPRKKIRGDKNSKIGHNRQEVSPNQVIPLEGNGEFKDF